MREGQLYVPLSGDHLTTSHSRTRDDKLELLCGALLRTLHPLYDDKWTGSKVRQLIMGFECFSFIVSYCWYIPEGKDVFEILNGASQFPCTRCLILLQNMSEADAHPKRTIDNIRAVYREAEALYEKVVQLQHRKWTALARLRKR